eukprot:1156373-Pelagomonas_calceolata.AAC.2
MSKHSGAHGTIQPPKNFASEVLGLFLRADLDSSRHQSKKKNKDSYMNILPDHIHSAIQKWALVTQEKWPRP